MASITPGFAASFNRRAGWLVKASALGALCTWGAAASAQDIGFINQFRNVAYHQSSDTAVDLVGAFFATSVVMQAGAYGAYTDGVMTFAGPASPTPLATSDGGQNFSYQTGFYPSQAMMDADFPLATTYSYSLNPANPLASTANTTAAVGAAAYATDRPQLTGSSWSSLQGMNAAAPLTLTFNPFAVAPGTDVPFVFFSIFDNTAPGTSFFPVSFATPPTSGVTLAAGYLPAGHSFTYELIYSDRVLLPNDGTTFLQNQLGFDMHTTGNFSTAAAVPEPQSWALMLGGLLVLGAGRRRATARRPTTAAGHARG